MAADREGEVAWLQRLAVGGTVRAWERIGFDVRDGRIALDGVTLEVLDEPGVGVAAWAVDGVGERPLDGLATARPGPPAPPTPQPNGITALDHVVVLTRDLDATDSAFAAAGLERRRVREVPGAAPPQRQHFYVLGSAVCELVGPAEGTGRAGSARFWGLAFVAPDLDDTVAALGLLCGPVRDAVQPGRRIATLRHRAAGLPMPVVLLSPRPAGRAAEGTG